MARKPTRDESLDYHAREPAGKIGIVPTKPSRTQWDLSLAYTPGVAEPCRVIAEDPDAAFKYTNRGNTVAVITNGTAVLGLGDIGPLAAKPVMEGKCVLFKRFGDVNALDIEVNEKDPEKFIQVVKALGPSFGGINLEDIKAPDCFIVEHDLQAALDIPVFHDDQHGTAIIAGAALLNALEIAGKRVDDVQVVFSGAGAAAIGCARFFHSLGMPKKNMLLTDSKGVCYKGRTDGMNRYKEEFARETDRRTLADAMRGADVFVGVSVGGIVKREMVASMAPRPIVMAMANPDPEIMPEEALAVRPDVIMATGRSDYPNQVNNVLGFPFIFRGALDVRAKAINTQIMVAATKALAALAREDVPDLVARAYGADRLQFGKDYLIPKPLDPRVLLWVAPAVAKAAMDSGVSRKLIDLDVYTEELERRQGKARAMMRIVLNKAREAPKRVVLAEGNTEAIVRAAVQLQEEGYAHPILLGEPDRIKRIMGNYGFASKLEIVEPRSDSRRQRYADLLYERRHRKGVTKVEAWNLTKNPNYFGACMVAAGDADVFMSGLATHYPDALRPALQVIGTRPGAGKICGLYMMTFRDDVLFFADTTVNIDPSAEDLADIALQAAEVARRFNVTPRVAMLSFSNFGSTSHPFPQKVARAVAIIKERAPDLEVDGEMQADTAVVEDILRTTYPFSSLKGRANVLIFPNLESGNIAYKLLQRLADAEATGPILVGPAKPVMILQRGDAVEEVVDLAAIAVVEAQEQDANGGARPRRQRS